MFFSNTLKDRLDGSPEANEPIVYDIRTGRGDVEASGIDYVDLKLDGSNIAFSFMPKSRWATEPDRWNGKGRQSLKVGRFLKRAFPQLNDDAIRVGTTTLEKILSPPNHTIEIISGEDIRQYYHQDSYYNLEQGTLAQSCMRHDKCKEFFDIYTKNDVKLVVVKRDNGKISARALLWNVIVGKTKKLFLDRIYYNKNTDELILIEWAKENVQIYKGADSHYVGMLGQTKIVAPLDKWKFGTYPYLDNLVYVDKRESTLSNKQPSHGEFRTLRNTDGKFSDAQGDYSPPVEEGEAWVPSCSRAYPIEETVTIGSVVYHQDQVSPCGHCDMVDLTERFKSTDTGLSICSNHTEFRQCDACANLTQETDAVCGVCREGADQCYSCDRTLIYDYDKWEDASIGAVCPQCFFEKYDNCMNCGEAVLRTALTEGVCCTP